jgi:hypothetical protein
VGDSVVTPVSEQEHNAIIINTVRSKIDRKTLGLVARTFMICSMDMYPFDTEKPGTLVYYLRAIIPCGGVAYGLP